MTNPAFLEMEQDDKSTMAMNLRLQLMQKRLEKVQSERKALQTEREQRRADTRRLAEFRAENAMLKEQIEKLAKAEHEKNLKGNLEVQNLDAVQRELNTIKKQLKMQKKRTMDEKKALEETDKNLATLKKQLEEAKEELATNREFQMEFDEAQKRNIEAYEQLTQKIAAKKKGQQVLSNNKKHRTKLQDKIDEMEEQVRTRKELADYWRAHASDIHDDLILNKNIYAARQRELDIYKQNIVEMEQTFKDTKELEKNSLPISDFEKKIAEQEDIIRGLKIVAQRYQDQVKELTAVKVNVARIKKLEVATKAMLVKVAKAREKKRLMQVTNQDLRRNLEALDKDLLTLREKQRMIESMQVAEAINV